MQAPGLHEQNCIDEGQSSIQILSLSLSVRHLKLTEILSSIPRILLLLRTLSSMLDHFLYVQKLPNIMLIGKRQKGKMNSVPVVVLKNTFHNTQKVVNDIAYARTRIYKTTINPFPKVEVAASCPK